MLHHLQMLLSAGAGHGGTFGKVEDATRRTVAGHHMAFPPQRIGRALCVEWNEVKGGRSQFVGNQGEDFPLPWGPPPQLG